MSSFYKKIIAIIGLLLALAAAFGIWQRDSADNPEFQTSQIHSELLEAEPVKIDEEEKAFATTFLVGGDVSLSRNIAYQIDLAKDPLFPFRGLENVFRSVDFTFANLETPFSNSDFYTPKNTLVFNAPKKNVRMTIEIGSTPN